MLYNWRLFNLKMILNSTDLYNGKSTVIALFCVYKGVREEELFTLLFWINNYSCFTASRVACLEAINRIADY